MKKIFLAIMAFTAVTVGCSSGGADKATTEWDACLRDSSAEAFGKALCKDMSPEEAARVYVDCLASVDSKEEAAKVRDAAMVVCGNLDDDQSALFSRTVDSLANALPAKDMARFLTLCYSASDLGRALSTSASDDRPLIEAIEAAFSSDTAATRKFKEALRL